jgi:hypothetical protein
MDAIPALLKCISIGFLGGFLMSTGPDWANGLLPLAVLIVLISTVLVLFDLTDLELATSVAVVAV